MKQFVKNLSLPVSFRFNWKITVFSLFFFTVFLNLSHWQLERAEEKRALQRDYTDRRNQPAVTPGSLNSDKESLTGRNLKLIGHYDNQRTFLLDNRVFEGKVGYEVISPIFLSADSKWDLILINRGWIAMGATRNDPVEIARIEAEISAPGWIYIPRGEMLSLASEVRGGSWPRVIQRLDIPHMITELNTTKRVFPFIVRLHETSPGALPRRWPIINMLPEKHTGYAVQWFVMAITILIAYVWASFNN